MITEECKVYCYKSLTYFGRVFTEGKYYNVTENIYMLSDSTEIKSFFTMMSDNNIKIDFGLGSVVITKILEKHFLTESQLRKQKLLKLQEL